MHRSPEPSISASPTSTGGAETRQRSPQRAGLEDTPLARYELSFGLVSSVIISVPLEVRAAQRNL